MRAHRVLGKWLLHPVSNEGRHGVKCRQHRRYTMIPVAADLSKPDFDLLAGVKICSGVTVNQ
jgi:hypothetical protein